MEYPRTWRDVLASLLDDTRARERLARAIGVDGNTLQRWARSEATPLPEHLNRLLNALPQHRMLLRVLIAEEFEERGTSFDLAGADDISVAFSARLLAIHSHASPESRSWSICTSVLAEVVKQLDQQRLGFSVNVMRCMLSSRERCVCSLREYAGLGTAPWSEQVEFRTGFLGAEALAGYAVITGQPQIVRDTRLSQRFTRGLPEHTISAAAFPILHTGQTAGCVLVVSTQPDYFAASARFDLLQKYTDLLLLAFAPEDFYPHTALSLQTMPSLQDQKPYLSTFQQRIMATLKTAFAINRSLSYAE
ncbi:MAG TPA: GAF domain-containing protein, partial [Ktedonobacteraceae bacterium]|nr:GAF domain-containing protein [Ktedonobacteraceae bacterium]